MPHTLPPPDTVAMAGGELLHAPPPVALLSVTQLPIHTVLGPLIADGSGNTVATAVMLQPVPMV